jgi:hypothetical protein
MCRQPSSSAARTRPQRVVARVMTAVLGLTALAGCGRSSQPGQTVSSSKGPPCFSSQASVSIITGQESLTVQPGTILAVTLVTPFGLVAEPTTTALLPWTLARPSHNSAHLEVVKPCAGVRLPTPGQGEVSRWFYRAAHAGIAQLLVGVSQDWKDAYGTTLCSENQLVTCEKIHKFTISVTVI